jgi:arsenate reductase-like glutaredoxin family protein
MFNARLERARLERADEQLLTGPRPPVTPLVSADASLTDAPSASDVLRVTPLSNVRRSRDQRSRRGAGIERLPSSVAQAAAAGPVRIATNEEAPRPAASGARATVYGASWCSACRATVAWMRHHAVSFVERDIDTDPGARDDMERVCARTGISCTGIPVVEARGRAIVGYDPEAFAAMVGR